MSLQSKPDDSFEDYLAADACVYPDLIVICDRPTFLDERQDVLTDATLIAELLSRAIEACDRGGKFALYRALSGLKHDLLIAQDRVAADLFTHQPEGRWILDAFSDPDAPIPCEAIGCTLSLREIYDRVELEQPTEGQATEQHGRNRTGACRIGQRRASECGIDFARPIVGSSSGN
jgi:Uma2 family endonuclease